MGEPARPWSDLLWGLCIFDDLVEYTGPECQKYESIFLARLLACVSSPQPEVRQAAAYGCGVLGQFGGPGLAAAAAQAIPLLVDEGPLDTFSLVLLLLLNEHVVVEELLETLVGVVD